jgi:sugar phosphate isomerase/epimerase
MSAPKVSLSMLHSLSEPFDEMVKRLPDVGTRYIEIVDDGWHILDKQRVAALKEVGSSYSLEYTVHAPFADINIASPTEIMRDAALKRLMQSIECAAELEAKTWVLHPGIKTGISSFYPDAEWKQNISSIKYIVKVAEDQGLTVALENLPGKYWFLMSTPEEFERFYTESGLDVGIVFDVAHAHLEKLTEQFLQKLPEKITHIHVSDNLGEIDNHFGIGYGNIDYPKLAETVKRIGYSGKLVIESSDHLEESIKILQQLFA